LSGASQVRARQASWDVGYESIATVTRTTKFDLTERQFWTKLGLLAKLRESTTASTTSSGISNVNSWSILNKRMAIAWCHEQRTRDHLLGSGLSLHFAGKQHWKETSGQSWIRLKSSCPCGPLFCHGCKRSCHWIISSFGHVMFLTLVSFSSSLAQNLDLEAFTSNVGLPSKAREETDQAAQGQVALETDQQVRLPTESDQVPALLKADKWALGQTKEARLQTVSHNSVEADGRCASHQKSRACFVAQPAKKRRTIKLVPPVSQAKHKKKWNQHEAALETD
jgi:hypothetical protein